MVTYGNIKKRWPKWSPQKYKDYLTKVDSILRLKPS